MLTHRFKRFGGDTVDDGQLLTAVAGDEKLPHPLVIGGRSSREGGDSAVGVEGLGGELLGDDVDGLLAQLHLLGGVNVAARNESEHIERHRDHSELLSHDPFLSG